MQAERGSEPAAGRVWRLALRWTGADWHADDEAGDGPRKSYRVSLYDGRTNRGLVPSIASTHPGAVLALLDHAVATHGLPTELRLAGRLDLASLEIWAAVRGVTRLIAGTAPRRQRRRSRRPAPLELSGDGAIWILGKPGAKGRGSAITAAAQLLAEVAAATKAWHRGGRGAHRRTATAAFSVDSAREARSLLAASPLARDYIQLCDVAGLATPLYDLPLTIRYGGWVLRPDFLACFPDGAIALISLAPPADRRAPIERVAAALAPIGLKYRVLDASDVRRHPARSAVRRRAYRLSAYQIEEPQGLAPSFELPSRVWRRLRPRPPSRYVIARQRGDALSAIFDADEFDEHEFDEDEFDEDAGDAGRPASRRRAASRQATDRQAPESNPAAPPTTPEPTRDQQAQERPAESETVPVPPTWSAAASTVEPVPDAYALHHRRGRCDRRGAARVWQLGCLPSAEPASAGLLLALTDASDGRSLGQALLVPGRTWSLTRLLDAAMATERGCPDTLLMAEASLFRYAALVAWVLQHGVGLACLTD